MSNNQMAAAMVARGINVKWLRSIENEPKAVKGAGMPPGMVTKLSLAGVIGRAGRAMESRAALWKPGPHYNRVNYPPINWRACNSHRGYIWLVDFLPASIQTSTPYGHLVAAYFGKCDHRHYHANCHQYHALRSIVTQNAYRLKPYFSGISECLGLSRGG